MQEAGKVNRDFLHQIFTRKTGYHRKEVIQGPEFGVDVALIDIGDEKALAIASDPLSMLPAIGMQASAWLSVHLMANDIATTGYAPMFGQLVLNLPSTLSNKEVEEYWNFIHEYCTALGVHITGGHTGFDPINESTIAGGGTLLAIVDKRTVKTSAGAKPGDHILMTKSAALSSTAILAKTFPNHIRKNVGDQLWHLAEKSFFDTSILPEVLILREDKKLFKQISAMHDVTEGGILGAIFEMATASKVGVSVEQQKITVAEPQRLISQLFNIDPLRSIGAGSLLICCKPDASKKIVNKLNKHRIQAAVIGEMTNPIDGMYLKNQETNKNLTYQKEDPYWSAYFDAVSKELT